MSSFPKFVPTSRSEFHRVSGFFPLLLALLLTALAPLSVFGGGTYKGTWTGTAGGSWTNSLDWTPAGGPPNGQTDTATFNATVASQTITMDAAIKIAYATFNNSGATSYTFNQGGASGSLGLNGNGDQIIQNGSGAIIFGTPVAEQVAGTVVDGTGTGNITFNGVINLGPNGHTVTFQGTNFTAFITAAAQNVAPTVINAGKVQISGVGTFGASSSTTINTGGTLQLNSTAGTIVNGVTLAGGVLQQLANNSNSLGALSQTASSTITLLSGGASSGKLVFNNTSSFWTSGLLTINNWTGVGYSSGTGNEIFFASSMHGTTFTGSQVQFTGFTGGAYVLSTGELVPAPEPGTCLNGLLLLGLMGGHLLKRKKSVKA